MNREQPRSTQSVDRCVHQLNGSCFFALGQPPFDLKWTNTWTRVRLILKTESVLLLSILRYGQCCGLREGRGAESL